MRDLVYGVGMNDRKHPTKVNSERLKEYILWRNLLTRCYSPAFQGRQPAYLGCSVSENFRSYSYFYEWCQKQIGFNKSGFQLDKDIIFKGNKLYSEDTCLFLPRELNNLIPAHKTTRGGFPLGVCAYQGKFAAQGSSNSPNRHIGYFNTPEEAFAAYKEVKEAFIKAQAEKWKNFIDPRAYEALMAYTVSITD